MRHYLKNKQALLLDMNSTFLFNEDRFDSEQDYSLVYQQLGGTLPKQQVNQLINASFDYLAERYPNYQNRFPTVLEALQQVSGGLSDPDIQLLTTTFALHERGYLSLEYAEALNQLAQQFCLGLVADIWAPKDLWMHYFEEQNILHLFQAISFSSEHGYVKPSPYGFQLVLDAMHLQPSEAVFIGDSLRRDLGGANAAGIDCILVGAAESDQAVATFPSLLTFCEAATLS